MVKGKTGAEGMLWIVIIAVILVVFAIGAIYVIYQGQGEIVEVTLDH